jgi:hypothetical protein
VTPATTFMRHVTCTRQPRVNEQFVG